MVLEFLLASTIATGVTFHEEIGRASANKLPEERSTARIGIQKELLDKAEAAIKNGKYKTALPLLNRVVKYDPYYPYYYFYLGQCYIHLGNLEKVLDNLYKVLACEGIVYITSDSFITSVRDMIKDIENIISVSQENKRGGKTTAKTVTNTRKNNARKRDKK